MNPLLKAFVAALAGALSPQAASSLHLSPEVLATVQAISGAIVAVACLFAEKPKSTPTTKEEPPPTDPGGN